MDTPTFNSDGEQVYKPQPGEYWKGGLKFRESYGGVIAEINDIVVKSGGEPGTYPQNFAGIIAAIADLGQYITEGDRPAVGDLPPGWQPEINPDTGEDEGDFSPDPLDGQLWFDTRQGRLFVAIDGQFWQTNGADGLTNVGPTPPTNPPVIGSTWFDTVNEVLYVSVGLDEFGTPLWQVVKGAGEVSLTAATLPLDTVALSFSDTNENVIPELPLDTLQVQKDFNNYIYEATRALDNAVLGNVVTVGPTPPTNEILNGTLWYDSTTLELSIYYIDNETGQWVPTSVNYKIDQDLANLNTQILQEVTTRQQNTTDLQHSIAALSQSTTTVSNELQSQINTLSAEVTNLPGQVDLTDYITSTNLLETKTELTDHINEVNARIPDVSIYASDTALGALAATVNLLPSKDDVDASIVAAQCDLSPYVTQADIDQSIDQVAADYISQSGGTLNGSIVVSKQDIGYSTFDFSGTDNDSREAFKFTTNDGYGEYPSSTFGSNNNYWELAHSFSSNEDFCWVYQGTDKVFSITKDGPACKELYLTDFSNNTLEGRSLTNKIDVKDRLVKYQSAFEQLRQAIANSTDFETLKAEMLTSLASV